MAQIRETQSRDTVIAVCRAVVLFLDTKTHVWKQVAQVGGISKVQLLQHFTSNSYRIFGRLETNEQVTIDIVLKQNIEYITSDDTDHASHQIRVSPQTIYLLQLSQDSDGKRFAIVVQRSLQLIKDSPQSPRDTWMTSDVTQPTTRDSSGNLSIRIPPVPKHSDRTTGYNFVGASSLSSRPGTPGTPRQNLEENIEPLCTELSRAINEGDVVGAQEIAAHLANTGVLLSIKLKNPKVVIVDSGMGSFSLKVVVEDRETTGGVFAMKVTSKTKIETLQEEVAVRYGFPPKVQRWVIGKKMSKPKDTLADCHVWHGGNTAYLYLMSGRSVGLKRHEFEKYRRKSLEANTPTSLQQHNGWILEPGGTATSPALAGNTSPLSRTVSMPILPTNDPPMDRSASSATLSQSGRVSVGFSGMGLPSHREEQMRSSMHISDIEEVLSASSTRLNISPFQQEIPLRNEGSMIPVEDVEEEAQGWRCAVCTFINVPTRPGCEICGSDRPANYIVPQNVDIQEQERMRLEAEQRQTELFQQALDQQEEAREQNFLELVQAAQQSLIRNTEEFDCAICFMSVPPGEGVVLRECLHSFCRDCLREHIRNCTDPEVQCPFQDNEFACHFVIAAQEIKALLSEEDFNKFLNRSLATAESQAANSFHCKTPNCNGWCIYEDNSNVFHCPVCQKLNCLTCKAIHLPDMNCKQYQEDLSRRAQNDEAARQTQKFLEEMITKGDAMKCPQCEIILLKKDGCDWMRCSMCRMEICWATRGPRWGPEGVGDVTGGCKCRVAGKKCHPKCRNCH